MFEPKPWLLAHERSLTLGPRALVMGIVNVTPDSFSDGGQFDNLERALRQAERLIAEGAQIIDVGGESTKPGAEPVSAQIEQGRILPLIAELAKRGDVAISVDTYRAETGRLAVEAGAHILNDVWGLQREPDMARVAAETGAGLVIMHTGRERTKLADPIEDQCVFLGRSLEIASDAGVGKDNIVLDPGFGFAKETADENLDLMARFEELGSFKYPFLVGTSRKRFIGTLTGRGPDQRDAGTAATNVILRMQGASIFRVHDVAMNVDALRFADAMIDRGLVALSERCREPSV